MLNINRFDIKTGKPIQETIEGVQQQSVKVVEHSYLEAWINEHGINAEFSVGRFYSGVNESDRQRLMSEGKVLAFTNGQDGYFTDLDTAQLMSEGGGNIEPLYAAGQDSAHNSVAYGSLIASDGIASTSLPNARILVIDNVTRRHGQETLLDRQGNPISAGELQSLYDKMGDGTMLVQPFVMESLITPVERDQAISRAVEKAGISKDLTSLGQNLDGFETAIATAEKNLLRQAEHRVSQFRAATPSFPGIAKGTMSSSRWASRLDVDAIISADDIKGDDGRFSTPGIKEVENFWVNRKSDGRYGEQAVGPQVKYCIPKATEQEINPQGKAQAEALAQVVGDPVALRDYYLDQKERERDRPVSYNELDELASQTQNPDWLYDVLKGDKYNQTVGLSHIVRPLNRYVRGEWLTNATHSTSVPSAMAQHHSQLKPWEVCNRDLPHGSIVAYYRSPLPNVGAVVLAINNIEVIRQQDPEAYAKQGVAYLPPSTAKDIAITDFDGDTNGFFVGYHATVQYLPEQIRQELESQSKGTSYEDGRALLETLMQQCDSGQERGLKPADNPIAVREFAAANAPAVRPPAVVKQSKVKHSLKDEESLSAAIWRGWEKTAENPIGKVANAGMTLQSLALELKYAPDEQREALLLQVSDNAQELLQRVSIGKLTIPSDEWLRARSFPEYGFKTRIQKIAKGAKYLEDYTDPLSRRMLIDKGLNYASALLMDAANGPNAFNLQAAVDAAKSAQGIDENLHRFVKALQHKPDELRQHRKDHTNYRDGQALPTNTQEPIAWGVQAVNKLYQSAQVQQRGESLQADSQGIEKEENRNIEYRPLFSKEVTSEQLARIEPIVQTYRGLINAGVSSKARLSARRQEDQQPTLSLTTAKGKVLTIQMVSDKGGQLPIWRADGPQPDWTVTISRNAKANDAKYEFPVQLAYPGGNAAMGYVSPASAAEHKLEKWTTQQPLSIQGPSVETQVPYAQQNDSKYLFERANRYVEEVIAVPSEKDPMQYRTELASKLWPFHSGMKMVLRHMPEVVTARLQTVPTITLNNLKYVGVKPIELIADGPRIVQFGTNTFVDKSGQEHTRRSVAIVEADGDLRQIGTIGRESIGLPSGVTYMAAFLPTPTSPKSVDMQVMDLPTVEQTPAELAAFEAGRCHLTFDCEPHAAYGVRAGDIVVAQSEDGGEQIALRVKDQHKIKEAHVEQGAERWSAVERAPAHQFSAKFAIAQSSGKELWGLTVEPLGTYRKGQILPMLAGSDRQGQNQQAWAASISETVTLAYRLSPNKPVETQYYSISSDGTSLSLSLRDSGQDLASFNLASGEVISADGLREIDVERWVENRQTIEQIRQSRVVSESASLER